MLDLPVKPLLLLDVDGILNPDRKDRPGFEPHRVEDDLGRVYTLALSWAHGRVLTRLREDFDLTWCTTWWKVANERISPLMGLPDDLPAVPLPKRHDHPIEGGAFWKTPHVRRYANGRPLAWFDDEVSERIDTEMLTGSFERPSIYADTPPVADACVIRVHSKWGLERKHIDQAKDWRAGLGIEQA